jgi:hypothetical protein
MTFMYISGGLYGIGSGIWIDALAKVKDPGVAVIAPIMLGAAVPVGFFLWDEYGGPLHRGVPASFATQTTVTWIFATGGGVGGWAFGEWIRPDPRSMGFIASTSAWGAISGSFLGIAVSGADWKDGASVAGLIGYNVGVGGGGALSIIHTPSWRAQKYMWGGYAIGALAGCLVFPFYLFSDADAKHGFIGPSLGGVAGAALMGAFNYDLKDPEDTPKTSKIWKPPFDVAITPLPALTPPTVERTAARRSLETLVGPERSAAAPMPGVVLNAIGEF